MNQHNNTTALIATESAQRVAVIIQPTYLPWLGYFEQMYRADVFVFLDTAQFAKSSWHSRNRLKGLDDNPILLTVPVASSPLQTPLKEIRIAERPPQWRQKHLYAIQTCLGSAPYFKSIFPLVEEWLLSDYEYLTDLTIAGVERFAKLLNLSATILRASDLNEEGQRTERLVNICRQVGATSYYSAIGSMEYMVTEEHLFANCGISVAYQHWEHPVYPQRGNTFASHMSVLDALMNIGPEATSALITGNKV